MALDSKQKRGSAIGMSLPHRQWAAEPDGTLANTDRVSLMKYCAAITPASSAADDLATKYILNPSSMMMVSGG